MNSPRWCWPCCDGRPPAKVEQDVIDEVKATDGDFNFERLHEPVTCHNCPDVVQAQR